jgi:hypothetical protein
MPPANFERFSQEIPNDQRRLDGTPNEVCRPRPRTTFTAIRRDDAAIPSESIAHGAFVVVEQTGKLLVCQIE